MEAIFVTLLFLVLFVLLGLIGVVIWLGLKVSRPSSQNNEQIANLSGKLDAIQNQVDGSLQSMSGQVAAFNGKLDAMQRHVDSSLQSVTSQVSIFGEMKETLGKVTEATNHVAQLGEDINKLENILQSPTRRGGFGEILLENLLSQIIPEKHYRLQYCFQNNTRVDAAILLGQRILPIDSKFPLYGFNGSSPDGTKSNGAFVRTVKSRIDETAKYILPTEQTFEFAMMYIPAENIYYEIVSNEELFNYSMQRRVIPVSPNSFIAYLQVVVFGLRGMQIEENARQILEHISSLQLSLNGVQEIYEKLGTNITHTQNKYNELGKKLEKFSGQLGHLAAETVPDESTKLLIQDNTRVIYQQGNE
jgi:DNA recombination protein RmuC